MPVKLKVRSFNRSAAVMVNALAPALNWMLFTCVTAESLMLWTFEVAKIAVSPWALGTVAGVQLPAVFQSPSPGISFHVALPAKTGAATPSSSAAMEPASGFKARRSGEGVVFFI